MHLTGGCFCGAVRYRIDAPLAAARSCHCSRCRKAFSGPGSAYAEVVPDSFSWTTGEEQPDVLRVGPRLGPVLLPHVRQHAVRDA